MAIFTSYVKLPEGLVSLSFPVILVVYNMVIPTAKRSPSQGMVLGRIVQITYGQARLQSLPQDALGSILPGETGSVSWIVLFAVLQGEI